MIRSTVLELLTCPACGGRFDVASTGTVIVCHACGLQTPVRNGVPRFVDLPLDPLARRTQASFGYEWTHFNDWTASGSTNFDQYFGDIDLEALRSARVLDAGCGMGRHARMIAPHVRQVVAVDFSAAIDQAARNTRDAGNVDCVQADVTALPLADGAFDFVYSLGVLHHISDTAATLAALVRRVRPGGKLRVYLYWKHHGFKGMLLKVVAAMRAVTTRLPHPVLRGVCWALSAIVFVVVIAPYRMLSRAGVRRHESFPLFVYARYPFRILYNDQFDRFSAPLEKRFDRDEVRQMLEAAGLRDVRVFPSFGWIGEGTR
jgi:SAM-dependent methyltransferase